MKQSVTLSCLGALLIVGPMACHKPSRNHARSKSSAMPLVVNERTPTAEPPESSVLSPAAIPADVTYTIINTDVVPEIKRSLDVRLSRKVEEDVLRSIAMKLKEADPKRYERTFIVYYLPGMVVGSGGWATTHFDPELNINILGLTIDQEAALTAKVKDATREVVGSWLDQSPMIGGKISIYRKNGKLYMETTFKDGSRSKSEMVERPSSSGRRFEEKSGSSFGEHYVIDQQGNLQIRDQEGLIATARKIE